jgi:hypothetical protein
MANKKKLLGFFGVDSGQVMIGDPGYLNDWKENKIGDEGYGDYSWAGACATTMTNERGGTLVNKIGAELAVVSSTGIGDGVYPVVAHYTDDNHDWGKRIARLEIIFMPELDGDDDWVEILKTEGVEV